MDLEERSLEPTMEQKCSNCGAELTKAEVLSGRERGGPFLCTTCLAEQLPTVDDNVADEGEFSG